MVAVHPKCSSCGSAFLSENRFGVPICEHCLFRAALHTPIGGIVLDQPPIASSPEGNDVFGRYVVGEEIGRGGMGVIFRSRDRTSGKTVALKRVLPEHARCPEFLARFEREAQAASSLLHPHLLPIYEVGHGEDGSPFFTMELASGGSLRQCKQRYRGRWRQIAELLSKICDAVQSAHDQGILHRDLKPGNILFNEDYEPLVADFGLAKRFTGSSHVTPISAVCGTPLYVAPEQAAGESENLTPAADVYSLGVIFYELLTGQTPSAGESPLEVSKLVGKGVPRKPRQVDSTIPKNLETICMRALRRQPKQRYQAAQELSDDLERWLAGQDISRQPAAPQLWRGARLQVAIGWCAAFAAIIYSLSLGLTHRGQSTAASPASFAVTVNDLDPSFTHQGIADEAAQKIKNNLSKIGEFCILDPTGTRPTDTAGLLNPISFGRASGAQFVLAGNVRYTKEYAHILLRLFRSDTGDVLWYSGKILPVSQMPSALNELSQLVAKTLQKRWQANPEAFFRSPPFSEKPDALIFFNRARELTTRVDKRDLEAAVALLRHAITLDPRFSEARSMLAYALITEAGVWRESDKFPPALIAAQEALSCNPYSALAHRSLGTYYYLEADYPKAITEIWEALQLNPASAGGNMALGDCLRQMGSPSAAIRWLKRAAQLDPVHSQFSIAEAESFMMLGQDDQALAALDRGAQLQPDQSDTVFFSAVIDMWQKKYDVARSLCSAGCARSPDYPDGLTLAAMIDFFAGEGDEGEREYEKLRDQNCYEQSWRFPGAVNPSSALAYLASERGDTLRAEQLTREALNIDHKLLAAHPHNSRILHDIAATLSAEGDSQGAMKSLQEAFSQGWIERRSTANDPRFRLLTSTSSFTSLLSRNFSRAITEGTDSNGK